MLLKNRQTGVLIEVLDTDTVKLIDPSKNSISGKVQAGEEEQPPEEFSKAGLCFPSDEPLPRCWMDSGYQSRS